MASVYKSLSKRLKADSDTDEEEEQQDVKNVPASSSSSSSSSSRKNRQRILVLSSRGVTYRQRHLLNDIVSMLPHGRKDSKLDTKSKLYHLNEVAELYNCNNILFFEARKRKDLYLWMSKAPNGPCAKFHVQNLHTMEELHFTGNCLKGSRPLLSFDSTFDVNPYTVLIKELLLHIFGVPKGARKSKPFIDHILSFTIADGKIWFRNYQIQEKESDDGPKPDDSEERKDQGKKKKTKRLKPELSTDLSLIEIGPRFILTPIVILEGSFGGPVIYENKEFISPNALRAELRNRKAQKYNARTAKDVDWQIKRKNLGLDVGKKSELDNDVLFR